MTDQLLYLKDLAARKTISKDEWMRGDKISFLDRVNGSGNIEHIPKGQLFSQKDAGERNMKGLRKAATSCGLASIVGKRNNG